MKLQIDHHVHSKYSACCRGTYDFQDIIRTFHDRDFRYYCVTDHIHSNADNGGLQAHHDALRAIPAYLLDRPVYIGVEVTFNARNGAYASAFRTAGPQPAYIVGGGHHIPNTEVSMGSIPRATAALRQCDDKALTELFAIYRDMQCGAAQNRTIDILAHPYDLFFRCGVFDARQLELFAATVRLCREHEIAVEVNRASLVRCMQADSSEYEPFNRHCLRPKEFYARMIRMAIAEGVLLSPASDAHDFENIGNVEAVETFLTDMGVADAQILNLNHRPSRHAPGSSQK